MDAPTVIQTLRRAGVVLESHGDKLRVDAPSDVLTDDMRGLIREHKQALIAILNARDTAVVSPSLPLNGGAQARLPLPVLTCSNCGSSKLEPKVDTTLCLSCGQIDERCRGCDELIRDSDIECRKCGRSLL